jgi:electron transport complex protein RnfE
MPERGATPAAAASGSTVSATQDFIKGLWRENPVFVMLLGLCPTMAVTNTVLNALAMSVATVFVLLGAALFVSALRSLIPREVRISTYVVIIAAFVQIADMVLQAFLPATHKALGAFIPLIVVNCIVLARMEAFASRNTVRRATLDAAGMGAGFTLALVMMGGVREVLGSGSVLGVRVLPAAFEPWVIMNLPPGGFLMFGFLLLTLAWWRERKTRREAVAGVPAPAATSEATRRPEAKLRGAA